MAIANTTAESINATLKADGKAVLPVERAQNLAFALASCVDSRDVDDLAARRRDSWLCWDFSAWRSASSAVAPAQRVAA